MSRLLRGKRCYSGRAKRLRPNLRICRGSLVELLGWEANIVVPGIELMIPSLRFPAVQGVALVCCLLVAWTAHFSTAFAQSALDSPPRAIEAKQKLQIEQINQLIASAEFSEALASLEKLYEESEARLIEVGPVQLAGTQRTQKFVPVQDWCQAKIIEVLRADNDSQESYRQRTRAQASAAFQTIQQSKNLEAAFRAARRYRPTERGDELALLLADLYLESGSSLAAIEALNQIDRGLGFVQGVGQDQDEFRGRFFNDGTPWWLLASQVSDEAGRERLRTAWQNKIEEFEQNVSAHQSALKADEVVQRWLVAYALSPNALDQATLWKWFRAVSQDADSKGSEGKSFGDLGSQAEEILQWSPVESESGWTTFAASEQRVGKVYESVGSQFDLAQWPDRRFQLERFSAYGPQPKASRPRVGELDGGSLVYHPVVDDGRLYLNELTKISAFDLESGRPWPDIQPSLPLFDSQIAPSAYVPLGYPLIGTPRGTLTIVDDHLYARMGSPVTGWANRDSSNDGGSISYLVGLDLSKQGSLLAGFPLRLNEPEFVAAEFEGCPLVFGDLLIVAYAQRDSVGVRRSVAAFDRFGGELRWKSEGLAAGFPQGVDRANLISHQLLTLAGGRVYYNTNLGQIVCLDPLTGQVVWTTSYEDYESKGRRYPRPERFRYRDLNPCVISGGLVYCLPQDAPELIVLDATTGNLVWSTSDTELADAIHLVGREGGSIVVGGDRLTWLDARTGKVLGRFPAGTTPGDLNALPNPRGLGRGSIHDGLVYWPVENEVFVFPADLSGSAENSVDAPPIVKRYPLERGGAEGGNLLIAEGWFVYAAPARLMAFKSLLPGDKQADGRGSD